MKDIEKVPLLDQELPEETVAPQQPSRCGFRRLKGLICIAAIYGVYALTVHTLAYAGQRADKPSRPHHRHHESSWAINAFFRQQRPIEQDKVEELYLYVCLSHTLLAVMPHAFTSPSSVPDPASALQASREYATHPHLAGSSEDFEDAKVILKLFQDELGISAPSEPPVFDAGSPESRSAILDIHKQHKPSAWIDKYFPVMNTPLDRSLSILDEDGQPEWEADLVEDGDPRDPDAAQYRDNVPTFHGLSADGDVTGEVVYVNYGRKDDYDQIIANGGNLTGKIALARYGQVFRGLKASTRIGSDSQTLLREVPWGAD